MYIGWYFCRDRLCLNPRYRGLIQPNMFGDKLEPKAKDDWQVMVKRYDYRVAAVLSLPTVIDLSTQQLRVIGIFYEADQTSYDIKSLTWACTMRLPFPQCSHSTAPRVDERVWSSVSMYSTHWCPPLMPRRVQIYMRSSALYWLHGLFGALGHEMFNYTLGRKWKEMSINWIFVG